MVIILKKKNLLELQKELLENGEFINTDVTETKSENKFGTALLEAGIKIKPQHMVGDYSFDFKVMKYPILIEVDGSIHNGAEKRTRDYQKDRYAQLQGFRVLRFSNLEISREEMTHLVRQVKDMMADCIKQPREIQLYPITILEQIKSWFKK